MMLLLASYYFYMNWEPVYAILILLSTITTWGCGLMIDRMQTKKKAWLIVCLLVNLSILFLFKYLNFATDTIKDIFAATGLSISIPHFYLLLPVGISFYTFQAIGYTIDVYQQKIKPEREFLTYALFVSFFPQLVAGPIERAKNMLWQYQTKHSFNGDDIISGLKFMTWGYFMKLCIAENAAPYVDAVFNNLPHHSGTTVLMASPIPVRERVSMADAAAPTPGNTRRVAFAISSASRLDFASTPMRERAFITEVRFPAL